MTINVALGNGSKAQQFAQQMAIANVQKELIAGGKGHMVPDDRLFNTATELTKIMGHKNPDRFFADPSAKDPRTGQLLNPPQPPQPDPKVQIEQMKAQADQQNAQLKIQSDQQSAQQQMVLQKQKQESDAAHQLMKTQADITLQQEKAKLEAQLALIDAEIKKEQHAAEMQLKQMEMHQKQVEHEHKIVQMGIQNAKTQADTETAKKNNKAATSDDVKGSHDAVMKALADHAAKLDEDSKAPVEIVRDLMGKAIGDKKGARVLNVKRGPDGRPQSLQ